MIYLVIWISKMLQSESDGFVSMPAAFECLPGTGTIAELGCAHGCVMLGYQHKQLLSQLMT